jgi:DNA invertase Pin-like site-specific DNA recombinase
MLKELKEDDTIYVSDLTRITRSTRDLFNLVDYIKQKKANLKFLKDTWLDLSEENPYSQFLMTVMGGVNQLERDLNRMRQREGIDLAKKEGKYRGRVKKDHQKHAVR